MGSFSSGGLRALVALATAGTLLAPAIATAGPTRRARAAYATRYVATQQNADGSFKGSLSPVGTAADAILAFVAARRGAGAIDDAFVYIRRNLKTATLGQKAKVVLALVAADRNPRRFARRNLVAQIRGTLNADGRYADPTSSGTEVTDHVLSVLALRAARAAVPRKAMQWLAAAQCGDGGWQFDDPAGANDDERCIAPGGGDFAASDSNTTAYAVMAWVARPSTVPLKADPFGFFAAVRDPHKGGWVYDPSFKCATISETNEYCSLSDANSTALVIQAYVAEARPVPRRAMTALTGLQYRLCGRRGGGFAFTYDNTTGERPPAGAAFIGRNLAASVAAVPAVVKKALPLRPFDVTRAVPKARRC